MYGLLFGALYRHSNIHQTSVSDVFWLLIHSLVCLFLLDFSSPGLSCFSLYHHHTVPHLVCMTILVPSSMKLILIYCVSSFRSSHNELEKHRYGGLSDSLTTPCHICIVSSSLYPHVPHIHGGIIVAAVNLQVFLFYVKRSQSSLKRQRFNQLTPDVWEQIMSRFQREPSCWLDLSAFHGWNSYLVRKGNPVSYAIISRRPTLVAKAGANLAQRPVMWEAHRWHTHPVIPLSSQRASHSHVVFFVLFLPSGWSTQLVVMWYPCSANMGAFALFGLPEQGRCLQSSGEAELWLERNV